MIILRGGAEWQDCSADTVSAFHEIARHQGSSALWLCGAGLLVVPKETQEDLLNFPYDEWRQEAIKKAQSGFHDRFRAAGQTPGNCCPLRRQRAGSPPLRDVQRLSPCVQLHTSGAAGPGVAPL